LQKVFSAMQVAHQGGIIHRDLKPQNVFLCRYANLRDFPKVLDFGISKILDAATTLTTPDSHIGTPEFMAPEQAKGLSLAADPRTDVFALGAILYRTLGGAAPFGGDTPLAVFYNVVHTEPRPLRELCPTLPEPVAAVVRRALAKEPADRFDSVAALSAAFCGAVGLPDEAAIIGAAASGPPARAPAIETRPDDNNQMGFQSTLGSASGEKLEAAPAATATRGRAGGPRARKVAVLAIVGGLLAAVALGALGLRILQRGAPAVKPATAPPPPEDLGVLDAARAAGAADAARDRAPDRARPTPKTAATKRRKHRTSRPKARDTKAEPGPAPRRPADEKDVDY
jgi:serine/threonine-protein kinase